MRTQLLAGRAVAIVLEKASTRTRVSFEVGCAQLGMHPVVLGVQGSQLGRGEPIRDTARVLAGYCDAIVFRTSTTARLLEMATATRPGRQCALRRRAPGAGALRRAHGRGGARRAASPDKRVAFVGRLLRATWRGRGSRPRALFGFHLVLAGPRGHMPPRGGDRCARART